jgi:hypothetical protein
MSNNEERTTNAERYEDVSLTDEPPTFEELFGDE